MHKNIHEKGLVKKTARRSYMIDVTKMNGLEFTINADLIEVIEEVPDTIITLTTGKKIMVKESRLQIKNLVKGYKHEIFTGEILGKDE